jgi:hypothetical protein
VVAAVCNCAAMLTDLEVTLDNYILQVPGSNLGLGHLLYGSGFYTVHLDKCRGEYLD